MSHFLRESEAAKLFLVAKMAGTVFVFKKYTKSLTEIFRKKMVENSWKLQLQVAGSWSGLHNFDGLFSLGRFPGRFICILLACRRHVDHSTLGRPEWFFTGGWSLNLKLEALVEPHSFSQWNT